jgi:hypothetical protein
MDESVGLFLFFIAFVIIASLVGGALDGDRIKEYIESSGGTLISKEWSPFGTGWFGSRNERIYKISYLDKDNHKHEAYAKTSLFSGVYFTEDKLM